MIGCPSHLIPVKSVAILGYQGQTASRKSALIARIGTGIRIFLRTQLERVKATHQSLFYPFRVLWTRMDGAKVAIGIARPGLVPFSVPP